MNKNFKTVALGLLSVAFLVLVIWSIGANTGKSTRGAVTNSSAESPFVVGEPSYDFGDISMANGKVSRIFKIKNATQGAATLTKLYTSCMCTSASLKKDGKVLGPYGMPGHGFVPSINEPINAGEEFEIEVVFDPAAHGPAGVGPISRIVYAENNIGKPLEIGISAYVKP
ncbi:MAG: DUF1573 domain-containing protein [Candidatus Liptonbacteria bacterium]|nr:DUF1573 domain-containing protein [Candidatus Liptonbacteria bacterium]